MHTTTRRPNTSASPTSATLDVAVDNVADLAHVPFVQLTPAALAATRRELWEALSMSAGIHPDWDADTHVSYLVNDAYWDAWRIRAVVDPGTDWADVVDIARRRGARLVAEAHARAAR